MLVPRDVPDLIYTPVRINGIAGMAVVDSGANMSFIAQEFVQKYDLPIKQAQGAITDGKGKKMASRVGTVQVNVLNGERTI